MSGTHQKTGAVLILSGPSGAGKSSLCQVLFKEFGDRLHFSISSTTRSPRNEEKDGVHYHFITQNEFEAQIQKDNFLEWARVHNNYYGTSKEPILEAMKMGKIIIFDVDVQGHKALKNYFGNLSTSIFITTPTYVELQNRLLKRGSDDEGVIQSRLTRAKSEIKEIKDFDFLIINENLQESSKKILDIAHATLCKSELFDLDKFYTSW